MGREESFILLSFCFYHVDTIVVEYSYTDSLVKSSTTVTVCSSFALLCTSQTSFWLHYIEWHRGQGVLIKLGKIN